ncbi:DUF2304 domain-containing protein [Actinotalea sp. K2]|uniref:DUF2304 domain-containing protein n=1 Tax=Actinotalea sp. K2 TaxID=2939438 RepID=UPI0020174786|nr:DUF2304 domain-containing protein [Actinotalea sp. K2]MCL3862704.1 DUF2304 domain-containing protein [Actinotalea sp. K2]
MNGHLFALACAVIALLFMFELLRRRRLREKYAVLWMVVAVVVLVSVVFPQLLEQVSSLVGITVPINLVFFSGLLVLLVVCVQLSAEISTLEHESQTLAEESALLRNRVERLERATGAAPGPPPVADPDVSGRSTG